MKLLLLGVVIALCRADVIEDTIKQVLSKVAKTAVTKAISSLGDVSHEVEHEVGDILKLKNKLNEEKKRVLDKAANRLRFILQAPRRLSPVKLIKTFVKTMRTEIPRRIEEKLKSLYKRIKKVRRVAKGIKKGRVQRQVQQPRTCHYDLAKTLGIFQFLDTLDFKDMPDGEQIFVYELLAAGETCRLHEFIDPETVERLFKLLDDMPMRYVHRFLQYLSRGLKEEGVKTPTA